MLGSFIKFTFGFIVIVLLGLGALALTSYASPYLNGLKATVLELFK